MFKHMCSGLALAALIAGCASPTPEERAAKMEHEIDEMIIVYGPSCEKLGFKADTDEWRNCILRLSVKESYEQYRSAPTTTTCFGHRGFFQCSTF